jgi:sugar O-acyltransferase (sialic acid O-acetyltransferase NeuD family)
MAATSPILLIGAGGHAMSCIDVVEQDGRFRIEGLVGREAEIGRQVGSYPVVGSDSVLAARRPMICHALVVVGQVKCPDVRIALYDHLLALEFKLPVIVSPNAYQSRRASLGSGTIVMHGSIVNAEACVGVNCIINSRALLEHGVTVGDHCHISTAAVVNGDATIGDGTFVGSGAVIREGVRIGSRCVIGMGVLVKHNLPDGSILVGNTGHGA